MLESVSTVFVVDDDEPVREGLAELMRTIQLNTETFATAHEFLESYDRARSPVVCCSMSACRA